VGEHQHASDRPARLGACGFDVSSPSTPTSRGTEADLRVFGRVDDVWRAQVRGEVLSLTTIESDLTLASKRRVLSGLAVSVAS
jgi:hypothetical protein